MSQLNAMTPSHHDAQQHGLPVDEVENEDGDKVLTPRGVEGHRVVVKGFYFARSSKRGADMGEKRRIAYREEFVLPPHPARLHAHGAMAHTLADLLPARLRSKDPDFRGISTHEVEEHENLHVDAPEEAPAAKKPSRKK